MRLKKEIILAGLAVVLALTAGLTFSHLVRQVNRLELLLNVTEGNLNILQEEVNQVRKIQKEVKSEYEFFQGKFGYREGPGDALEY